MDMPADPYQCERCRWDWRTRRFASFCADHQRKAEDLGNRFVARLYDLIPPAPQPDDPSAPQPDHETPRQTQARKPTAARHIDFDL